MVGDGVNDATALALADVGIAVHGGTGASILAADVVLTREGTAPLLDLLKGARSFFRVIARNLGLSLAYNAAGATLAVLGLVSPLLAAVLMPASSLTVTLSSAFSRTFAAASEAASGGRMELILVLLPFALLFAGTPSRSSCGRRARDSSTTSRRPPSASCSTTRRPSPPRAALRPPASRARAPDKEKP